MNTFRNIAKSSIFRKQIMALTGLFLIFFICIHLFGNLTLLAPGPSDGKAFIEYAHKLHSLPGLVIVEWILFAAFAIHIFIGVWLTIENRNARPVSYAVTKSHGGRTVGSRTMRITGILLFIFLILHLIAFTFSGAEPGMEMFDKVRGAFSQPLIIGMYVITMLLLGLHISHGFQSAFQTFGIYDPRCTPWIRRFGIILAVIVALGFAAIPVVMFMTK